MATSSRKFDQLTTWIGPLLFLAVLAPLAVLVNLPGPRGPVLSGRLLATGRRMICRILEAWWQT